MKKGVVNVRVTNYEFTECELYVSGDKETIAKIAEFVAKINVTEETDQK